MSGASPEAGSLGDSERGELENWKGMLGDLWVLLIVVQAVQTLERWSRPGICREDAGNWVLLLLLSLIIVITSILIIVMAIICRVGASWTTWSTRPFDDADFYPASSKDWQLAQHLSLRLWSEESCEAERSTNSTAFPMHRIRSWNGPWWRCARSTLAKRRTGFDVSDTMSSWLQFLRH